MSFGDLGALLIGGLLVRFVVTMVWIEQVTQLAELLFCVYYVLLRFVEGGIVELVSEAGERVLGRLFGLLQVRMFNVF